MRMKLIGTVLCFASAVRSAHRGATTYFPNQTRDSVGFRVARTIR